MGLQPDNDDLAQQKQCIEKSIELFPQHDTVLMLGADLLSQEGRFDEAMAACDQMQANSKDPNDAILIVIKANVVCQMGMVKYAEAQEKQSQQIVMEAQQLLAQGQELYAEAIKAEPNSIEALIQLAQLKSMMGAGEMEEALALCKQALPHARSRDEALDILHLKLMMENRLIAINEMRDNGMQI
jgi:tetratricopeptide (TPR) repeat protein